MEGFKEFRFNPLSHISQNERLHREHDINQLYHKSNLCTTSFFLKTNNFLSNDFCQATCTKCKVIMRIIYKLLYLLILHSPESQTLPFLSKNNCLTKCMTSFQNPKPKKCTATLQSCILILKNTTWNHTWWSFFRGHYSIKQCHRLHRIHIW